MENRKILFISPPFHAGVVEVAGSWIPLNLVYLAGAAREAGFEAEAWTTALHVPPAIMRSMPRTARALEKIGTTSWPAFSGVTCVAARKRTIEGVRAPARRVLAPGLQPVLQPGNGAMGRSTRQARSPT